LPVKRRRASKRDRANWLLLPPLLVLIVAIGPALMDGLGLPTTARSGAFPVTLSPTVSTGGDGLISGVVTHVRDGDTVEVGGVPIRFAKLDCAETGTAAGERATARMKSLAASGPFTCRLHGRRSYDREIGECAVGGEDVGETMIAERLCRRWR
jgi:endonuclease YncB( thermonuclease family)